MHDKLTLNKFHYVNSLSLSLTLWKIVLGVEMNENF